MRIFLRAAILVLSASGVAHAGAPTESQAKELLSRWVAAQNAGDADAYQAMYAASFEGVRRSGKKATTFDRPGWIADRAKMFKKPMQVAAADVKVTIADTKTTVRFTQTWASGTYRDAGTKEIALVLEGTDARIAREEMLDSKVLPRVLLRWILTPATGMSSSADVTLVASGSLKGTWSHGIFEGCTLPPLGVLEKGKTSEVLCREGDSYQSFTAANDGKKLTIGQVSGHAETGEERTEMDEVLAVPAGSDVFVEVERRAPETP